MADKIDDSPEEEAVKDEAREFMTGLVGTGAAEASTTAATTATAEGASILKSWKSKYKSLSTSTSGNGDGNEKALMKEFWSLYNPECTSLWTMTYDEYDSNENLEETIGFVKDLLQQPPGMDDIRKDCFALIHTLETLEIEGLWFFNGPDPTILFGANSETSWYTFRQLGPDANDLVKEAVAKYIMVPGKNKRLHGKVIKDTQIFS